MSVDEKINLRAELQGCEVRVAVDVDQWERVPEEWRVVGRLFPGRLGGVRYTLRRVLPESAGRVCLVLGTPLA